MKADEFKVVGYKFGHKDGKETTVIFYNKLFEDFEINSSDYDCVGVATGSEYFRKHLDVSIGDVISINYKKNTFSGQAIADGINIIEKAKK